MTGPCPECGHDPAHDELEQRFYQLEVENQRLRAALDVAHTLADDLVVSFDCSMEGHGDHRGPEVSDCWKCYGLEVFERVDEAMNLGETT